MNNFKVFIGKKICVEIPGQIHTRGLLVDTGTDLIVLFNGKDFIYIPNAHIHLLYLDEENYESIEFPEELPLETESDTLSVRKILNNSKGMFSEIVVANDQAIHGYVTNIMNDYFVFYSPVFHTMYISLQHLKWLIPYRSNQVPYALERATFTSYPSTLSLARSLDAQIKKMFGNIVIFDLGENVRKIGQLRSFQNNMLELVTAREEVTYVNARHVKSVHIPNKG
ncbi:DUF2642 domain-containing protein [Metabacillus bambusae]|uniref:DUF2642 domain-containing protein n=1 Tax=Metabacillus bambusae TaxID=2795218 RepID=A0ABS3NAN0_9BACI|nr:DUF2642 domain-containing protein [Metabacillus bambusae]MBO1515210.1 DUF2642 domain-containing protein [Metabacillus bambusae]